ncbi:hypothetical protein ACEWY4_007422 [Coilia grayii]|uniref:Retrotransposon gag domain-containing protein n=1 Tax=Coilia grayii TaxID=363190 RepID=A0ABD1KG76_9TELE
MAELEVIQQRARTAGPPRLSSDSGPDERGRGMKRGQRFAATIPRVYGPSSAHPDTVRSTTYDCPRTKMATYDGKEDWESFLLPFERLARKYGWNGAERVDRLHECLRGAAMRYVCSLPEHIREDYTLLKEHLTQRFGQHDPPATVRRKLGELRQSKESSAEFAEEVRRLITLAYPGVESLQDQLAADAFLKGLKNQKLAYEVMNKDPCSLAEAQKLVETHEHNYKATVGRETDLKSRARRVSWADEDDDMVPLSRRESKGTQDAPQAESIVHVMTKDEDSCSSPPSLRSGCGLTPQASSELLKGFATSVGRKDILGGNVPGLDFLRAANVTIQASGREFIDEEPIPAKIIGGEGPDYFVARVLLEKDVTLPPESELNGDKSEAAVFLDNLEQGLKEAQEVAREHLRAAQECQKRSYDVRAKERPYAVGDLVYIKDSTKKKGFSPKLQPPWKGPCIIVSCLGPVLYEVAGRRDKKVLHHDRLKPYTCDIIPGWIRRKRHHILQGHEAPQRVTDSEICGEPQSQRMESSSSEDQETGQVEHERRGRQRAARRRHQTRRQAHLPTPKGTPLFQADSTPAPLQKATTSRGRQVRPPVRYQQ